MPIPEDNKYTNVQQKEYWTRVWENRDVEVEDLVKGLEKSLILKEIIRNEAVGNRIMEAGCGLGQWVVYLTDKGYKVVGLDYSEPTIKRLNQTYPDCEWVVGDITDLQYENESFDAVLSWGVVEHFVEGPQRP